MKVVITGATGRVGSVLVPHLRRRGHRIVTVGRGARADFHWDAARPFPAEALEGAQAVIHLAAENLGRRWTATHKDRIRVSRVSGTRAVAEAIAAAAVPPRIFMSASAVGFYGDRGDAPLTETAAPGQGYLAELCRDWEAACAPAAAVARVVQLRMSIILFATEGVLTKMLPFFRLGLGGAVGTGRQYVGWISARDAVRAICHALESEDLQGPVNITAPRAISMADWARTLGRALGRPVWLSPPLFLLRWIFGEVVERLLVPSQNVIPEKLLGSGFRFLDAGFPSALRRSLVGRAVPPLVSEETNPAAAEELEAPPSPGDEVQAG